MTRTQVQLPDELYSRTKAYADSKEISMAEVFRNALEFYVAVHAGAMEAGRQRRKWTPPVCRSTGLREDPFSDENWRDSIYMDDLVKGLRK